MTIYDAGPIAAGPLCGLLKIEISPQIRSAQRRDQRIATGLQRFQIAWFESQGQKPFELLLRLYCLFRFEDRFQIARFDSLAIYP